jgi:trimeric autotransporter adhesin
MRKIHRNISESVSGATLVTLTVSPGTATKAAGATQQYTVAGVDAFGNTVPIAAADIAWTISNGAGGTISAAGLWTAGATPGTYQVRATHSRSGVYDESDAVATA